MKFRVVGLTITFLLILSLGFLAVGSFSSKGASPSGGGALGQVTTNEAVSNGTQPNVVIILTDDQPKGLLSAMPTVQREIADKGSTFTNAVIPTSLCCPSRTSLLTGLYSNQSGVWGNRPDSQGGYKVFKARGNEERTLAVKLAGAGYVSGMFGKYLNGYEPTSGTPRPVGWNDFSVFFGSPEYYNFRYVTDSKPGINILDKPNTSISKFVSKKQYSTTYFGSRTVDFIKSVPKEKPLFALFTPYAAHGPFTPEPKYRNAKFNSKKIFSDPSVNEKNVSDKPLWVQKQSKLNLSTERSTLLGQFQTLKSVDDQVKNILNALAQTGRLDNTLLVFTSDNGYQHGQHRLQAKNTPYRAATNVDLLVRYPQRITASKQNSIVSANVDLSATVLETVGLPNTTSGQPLQATTHLGIPIMGTAWRYGNAVRPTYCGWRTNDGVFARYSTGEEELYDYQKDPFELNNVIDKKEYASMRAEYTTRATTACFNLPENFGESFSHPNKKPAKAPRSQE